MIVAVGGLRPKQGTASNDIVHLMVRAVSGLSGEIQSRDRPCPRFCDLYVQHGFKLTAGLQSAMDSRIPYIILDHGYIDPRGDKFSISFNGFHGLSMPVDVAALPPRPQPVLRPWRSAGEFVYVFGQLHNDRAVRGQNMETWPSIVARQAAEAYQMPVKIRPHPYMISSWEEPLPPLSKVWPECYVAITWTSTAAVQAAIAGVPVVALHPANPAYPVAATSIGDGRDPGVESDRDTWLHNLSYRQYGFDELPAATEYVRRGYPAALEAARRDEYDRAGLRA